MSVLFALDPTSLLLGGVVLLCLLWWMSTRRPPGLPPGPGPALPLLGHLHLVDKDPRAQFCKWRRQFGDVFSLYMGGKLVVVLTSYSAICEALVTFADVFSHRPHIFFVDQLAEDSGILATSGPKWKEQRKTGLEILRAMGMGKNVLAEKIQEEITHFIQSVKDLQGAPMNLHRMTQISVSNNICSIIFGKRFDYHDPTFIGYIEKLSENVQLSSGTGALNFLPFLRFIPGDPFSVGKVMANFRVLRDYIGKQIRDHKKTPAEEKDETAENTDFIYSYLHQIQKHRTRGDVNTSVDDNNLHVSTLDLFVAGTETTSTALQWALLFFLHHPHVQDKCFKEISDLIGTRLPTMQDKLDLTYLEATILEVLRKGDIAPLSFTHASADDVTFRGYIIPKDTMIIPDLSCVLQDPDIWGDPENFRPERFIGPDGKLTRAEELIPFSMGRRACLGESLARMELFLYLATLIQHFHFLPVKEGQLPPLEGVFGGTYAPQQYEIRAVPRL